MTRYAIYCYDQYQDGENYAQYHLTDLPETIMEVVESWLKHRPSGSVLVKREEV